MIIILRTKSFDGYGSGHLKRSMILANEIKKVKGNEIDVIIALEGDKASFKIIDKTKLKYIKLPIDIDLQKN